MMVTQNNSAVSVETTPVWIKIQALLVK
jgi:hypothetical protein